MIVQVKWYSFLPHIAVDTNLICIISCIQIKSFSWHEHCGNNKPTSYYVYMNCFSIIFILQNTYIFMEWGMSVPVRAKLLTLLQHTNPYHYLLTLAVILHFWVGSVHTNLKKLTVYYTVLIYKRAFIGAFFFFSSLSNLVLVEIQNLKERRNN